VAKLAMSDKHMAMSPTIFSKFVMLRHSKLELAIAEHSQGDSQNRVAARRPWRHESPSCVRFHWSLLSLPTPSHGDEPLSRPGTDEEPH
jgi:hypothetical protein